MMLFWLICALFVVIALAFVLPTLLQRHEVEDSAAADEANIEVYRDQINELEADVRNGIMSAELFQHERDELERRLLEDVSGSKNSKKRPPGKNEGAASRGAAYAVALGIPLIAVGMYLQIGNQNAFSSAQTSTSAPSRNTTPPGDPGLNEQQRIEGNVAALAKRLEQNPNDTQGWIMLAASYTSLAKFSEASEAYAKATALKSDDAELWADYAFAVAMRNGRRLEGEPQELLKKALQLDPDNAKALQLAGSAAFQAKNYKEAIGYWERLLPRAGADTELGQEIQKRIDEAKQLAGK